VLFLCNREAIATSQDRWLQKAGDLFGRENHIVDQPGGADARSDRHDYRPLDPLDRLKSLRVDRLDVFDLDFGSPRQPFASGLHQLSRVTRARFERSPRRPQPAAQGECLLAVLGA
jgi:hypothetical protein